MQTALDPTDRSRAGARLSFDMTVRHALLQHPCDFKPLCKRLHLTYRAEIIKKVITLFHRFQLKYRLKQLIDRSIAQFV